MLHTVYLFVESFPALVAVKSYLHPDNDQCKSDLGWDPDTHFLFSPSDFYMITIMDPDP